jgi:Transmembrane secretion effector
VEGTLPYFVGRPHGDASARSTLSLWRPLRTPIFRNLLVADVVSDVGMFMQSVGAAWLMISLNAGPI